MLGNGEALAPDPFGWLWAIGSHVAIAARRCQASGRIVLCSRLAGPTPANGTQPFREPDIVRHGRDQPEAGGSGGLPEKMLPCED